MEKDLVHFSMKTSVFLAFYFPPFLLLVNSWGFKLRRLTYLFQDIESFSKFLTTEFYVYHICFMDCLIF